MLYANKQALNGIHKSTKHNKDCTRQQGSYHSCFGIMCCCAIIPRDDTKIQDKYKSDVYVMIGHHQEPNVYYIQLLNSSKPRSTKGGQSDVSCMTSRDLHLPLKSPLGDDGFAIVPSFFNRWSNQHQSNISNANDTILYTSLQYSF